MKQFHKALITPLLLLALVIVTSSCGESPDEKISKGHRDAIKSQCKNKSDPTSFKEAINFANKIRVN